MIVSDASQIVRKGTVVLCHGCFDIVHPGHIMHLEAAKAMGHTLVVSVTADEYVNKGPNRPKFPLSLRMRQVDAIKCVDYVIASNNASGVHIIETVKPDVYAKGEEYRGPDPTGKIAAEKHAVEALGGRLAFTSEPTFSSSSLIQEDWLAPVQATLDAHRHEVLLMKASVLKVVVVGETIVDSYWSTRLTGATKKEGVPAYDILTKESHVGGAAATAANIGAFTNDVHLWSNFGGASSRYVENDFVLANGAIVKTRIVGENGQILYRFAHIEPLRRRGTEKNMLAAMATADVAIINDFGHGLIPPGLIHGGISRLTCVNTQVNNSNQGNDPGKYKNIDYLCVNQPEAEALEAAGKLRGVAPMYAITRGSQGVRLIDEKKSMYCVLPALETKPRDTTGCGDTFLAISSLMLGAGASLLEAGFYGSVAAGLYSRIYGNRHPITYLDFDRAVRALLRR